jgi:hypothetical protein
MSVARWIVAHKVASAAIAVAVAGGGAGTAAAVLTASPGGPIATPTSVTETDTNGSATVTWSAPAGSSSVTGYRVSLYPTYTDTVPKPKLGPNGGLEQQTVPASDRSYTFNNLYEDCHQRYEIAVETVTAGGLSQPSYTPSFRPSGYVVPNQAPPYVVVLVDGIDSQQPGFQTNPYHPNTGPIQSYCPESWNPQQNVEEEADFAKPYGLAPASGPTGPWSFLHKWNYGETDSNGNPTTGAAGGPNLLYASEPKLFGGPGANGGRARLRTLSCSMTLPPAAPSSCRSATTPT